MAQSTRLISKRKLSFVLGNLETALNHLEFVSETYHKQHPDIAANILSVQNAIVQLSEIVESINKGI